MNADPAPTTHAPTATATWPSEPLETRETVASIVSALAGGRSLPAVAAEFGFGIQALRELLVRNTVLGAPGAAV